MAFLTLPTLSVGWSLTRVDIDADAIVKLASSLGLGPYPTLSISGRLPPSGERESVGGAWNVKPIAGRKPHATYSADGFDTFACTIHLYADSIDQDVASDASQIKAWKRKDPELDRPAILRFQCGDFSFTGCLTVVDARYGERWWTGAFRQVDVDITMEERIWPPPFDVMTRDPSKPPHLSRYIEVKQGDTFESIAKAEYGDPMLGVMLRQDHLVAFPQPGERVFCPDKSYFRSRALMPDSPLLGEEEDNLVALRDLLDEMDSEMYAPVD